MKNWMTMAMMVMVAVGGRAGQAKASEWGGAVSELEGVWILKKSDNVGPDGKLVPYCTGVHGSIIYTAEGYVSVALNCAPQGVGKEPADISGRKFFYTGRFEFDGKVVTHKLLNASDVHLMGTNFKRKVTIVNGRTLVLSGENQGQKFSAYWEKVR